jgi:hypothetical protein
LSAEAITGRLCGAPYRSSIGQMKHAVLSILVMLLAACSRQAPIRETVLHPGQSVTATNRFGTVTVSYVSPRKRKYEWDGRSQTVRMIPRPDRFLGKLGLYEPAARLVCLPGDARLVVEEAVRNFDDDEQMRAALREGSAVSDWVYTADGLVVGFGRVPERCNQINVDLYQFLVKGRKPELMDVRQGAVRLRP